MFTTEIAPIPLVVLEDAVYGESVESVVVIALRWAKTGNGGSLLSVSALFILAVESSSSLKSPNFVFLYTRQAMMLSRAMLGVANMDRIGTGTWVLKTIMSVSRFDIKLILCVFEYAEREGEKKGDSYR